jgi:hypothetical protein
MVKVPPATASMSGGGAGSGPTPDDAAAAEDAGAAASSAEAAEDAESEDDGEASAELAGVTFAADEDGGADATWAVDATGAGASVRPHATRTAGPAKSDVRTTTGTRTVAILVEEVRTLPCPRLLTTELLGASRRHANGPLGVEHVDHAA